MKNKKRGTISSLFGGFRRKPNRFRQVQRTLRRKREGKLPLPFYGGSDILTKEQWRKTVEKYNSLDMLKSLNKLEEKALLTKAGVQVPETYLVIETEDDIEDLRDWLEEWNEGFAIKPSSGHGGAGIKVIDRRVAGRFITISGKGIESSDILKHAERILKGVYTRGEPDRVIIERRLVLHRSLRELMTPGLPDIRVVSLMGFPMMAMTRLPTKRSRGKANIHQGAIGAGISISEGRITSATLFRKNVKNHPASGRQIVGFRFNMWESILETASLASDASGLDFVGVDLIVDSEKGVTVLEVNKRPGLEIQNANRAGLKKRLRFVESQIRASKGDIRSLGPGIKAELSRNWDSNDWKKVKHEETAEE
jgi:alpha-L-glutamate ligase-like protein